MQRAAAYLRGISRLVIGSYPTQFSPAFLQAEQAGRRRSHLCFRLRHLWQADTFLKDEVPDAGSGDASETDPVVAAASGSANMRAGASSGEGESCLERF